MCINQGFNYVCNKNGRLCTRCASYEEGDVKVDLDEKKIFPKSDNEIKQEAFERNNKGRNK